MKKETWKFIIQTLAAILTAIATSLGVTSCIAGWRPRSHPWPLHKGGGKERGEPTPNPFQEEGDWEERGWLLILFLCMYPLDSCYPWWCYISLRSLPSHRNVCPHAELSNWKLIIENYKVREYNRHADYADSADCERNFYNYHNYPRNIFTLKIKD